MNNQLTDDELFAIKQYIGIWYVDVNCLMDTGIDSELVYPKEMTPAFLKDEESLARLISLMENLYSAMIKITMNGNPINRVLFRGTNAGELKKIKNSQTINRFLSTTTDYNQAHDMFSNNKNGNPIVMEIKCGNTPYINVKNIVQEYEHSKEQEVIIAPYTKVTNITNINDHSEIESFNMQIEKEDFTYLPQQEMIVLKTKIIDDFMTARRACYRAIIANNDRIEFNNLLNFNTSEYTEEELKSFLRRSSEEYNHNVEIYNNWKQNIAKYLKSSFRFIEHSLGFNPIQNINEINANYNYQTQVTEINNNEIIESSMDSLPTEGIFII